MVPDENVLEFENLPPGGTLVHHCYILHCFQGKTSSQGTFITLACGLLRLLAVLLVESLKGLSIERGLSS